MQNRSALIIFTVLLALVCLYHLSFSIFTGNFEDKAENFATLSLDTILQEQPDLSAGDKDVLRDNFAAEYTRKHGAEPLYPVLGLNYYDCESQELKLGLDLQGGMSVTLEVTVSDLIENLAGKNTSAAFRAALETARANQQNDDRPFIDIFEEAWKANNEPGQLVNAFHNRDTQEKFPLSLTDDEVIVKLREEAEAAIANTEKIVQTRIDPFGVSQATVQRQQFTDRIQVEVPGAKDKNRIRKIVTSTAKLEFWHTYEVREFLQSMAGLDKVIQETDYPDLPALRGTTVVDTLAAVNGGDSLVFDTTGVVFEDLELSERKKYLPFRSIIGLNTQFRDQENQLIGAVVGFVAKEDREEAMALLNRKVVVDHLGYGKDLKFALSAEPFSDEGVFQIYALESSARDGEALLTGDAIVDAKQDFDNVGNIVASMRMNAEGAKVWKDMTTEAYNANGRQIAIVLDDLVYSAPTVSNGPISDGSSVITMGSNAEQAIRDAKDLANLLKAGSLKAKPTIVDEQVVGPSIGDENIRKGLISFAIALGVVLLYMIFYYRGAGLIADVALIANMFFLMGALASLGASLTLPGIAGIILTIGMAVDANVLIFERVKEELRMGAGLNAAITKGYQKAYSAIIDANLTTLFTGIVLYFFGSGPIKGFATTLIIGIFTSLFSAIFLTRLIISYRLDKKKNVSFYSEATKNWFTNTAYKFIPKRKMFYVISAILILVGAGSLFSRGLDLGVDFQGGRDYTVEFAETVSIDEVKTALDNALEVDGGGGVSTQVKQIGGTGQKVKVITDYLIGDTGEGIDEKVDAKMFEVFASVGDFSQEKVVSKKTGPTISDDFRKSAGTAVIIALAIIFLYIAFRFRRWQFGIGALVAMAHDVLIVLGLFSLFWGILPFSLEIDQAFIAAILTVVGYSINDTVVVFDRIREYLNERRGGGSKKVINDALNSTLSRTVNTSLSTFIVLFMIFLFGSDSIKGFTFALMVGVVVGTYSSLCIATPLVVDLSKKDSEKA